MNLKAELLGENSKTRVNAIVEYIGNDQKRFDELITIFLAGPYRVTQQASWPISFCIQAHPGLINPHLKPLLDYLKKPKIPDAVKRNTMRLLQFIIIPKKYYGRVTQLCFDYLEDRKEPVAIKAFSLTVLGSIIKDEPDLQRTLKLIIEDQLPYASPAFIVRANRVVKEMTKLN